VPGRTNRGRWIVAAWLVPMSGIRTFARRSEKRASERLCRSVAEGHFADITGTLANATSHSDLEWTLYLCLRLTAFLPHLLKGKSAGGARECPAEDRPIVV
jgi:hypothetical protein